jgi:CTP:molybdopterin cytidylyltransferase MocA
MPFVSLAWLQRLQKAWGPAARAVFSASEGRVGFPCILGSDTLTVVSHQIALGEFSLQRLAQVLGARVLTVPRGWRWQLGNINTPDDLADARLTRRVLAKLDFFENPLAGRL